MTVTTAKVAGCGTSPPVRRRGPASASPPAILYTADLCGADTILAIGGVQGVAAMAFGLFGLPKADILVGPGNQFVAEAKRILFGRVGIDMFAGPTDSLILADETADPYMVACRSRGPGRAWLQLAGLARHRPSALAEKVMELVPRCIAELPELNGQNADARHGATWRR